MKRTAAALLLLLLAGMTSAKDCHSGLRSNLHEIASGFYLGGEWRRVYYNLNSNSYYFAAFDLLSRYEAGKNLAIEVEGLLRKKKYFNCHLDRKLSPAQLKTLSLEYYIESLELNIKAGRQLITAGTGLVFDDFFDGLSLEGSFAGMELYAGAVVPALQVAREGLYCQPCFFYEFKSCWKRICQTDYGDHRLAFLMLGTSAARGQKVSFLFLRAATQDPVLSSSAFALIWRNKFPLRFRVASEMALQRFDQNGEFAWGWNLQVYRSIRLGEAASLYLKLTDLYGSVRDNVLFSPVYGNIRLVEYTPRQGHTAGLQLQLTPSFFHSLTLLLSYYRNYLFDSQLFEGGFRIIAGRTGRLRVYLTFEHFQLGDAEENQLKLETRIAFQEVKRC